MKTTSSLVGITAVEKLKKQIEERKMLTQLMLKKPKKMLSKIIVTIVKIFGTFVSDLFQ